MTDVYQVIMQAAEHIERFPDEFNFEEIDVPTGVHCGSPGCALGWIGALAEVQLDGAFYRLTQVSEKILGVSETIFYRRMNELNERSRRSWCVEARECARCMRLYARKYHAPARRTPAELVKELVEKLATGPRIPTEA